MNFKIFVARMRGAILYFLGGFPAIFEHRCKRLRKELKKKGVSSDNIDRAIVSYALADMAMHMSFILSEIFNLDEKKTARVVNRALETALNEIGIIIDEEAVREATSYYVA